MLKIVQVQKKFKILQTPVAENCHLNCYLKTTQYYHHVADFFDFCQRDVDYSELFFILHLLNSFFFTFPILPVKFIKFEKPEPHSCGFDQWLACSIIYFTQDHFSQW